MEVSELVLEIEWELVLVTMGVGANLAEVTDAHRPCAMRRYGKNAGLEMVAACPLDEPGIYSFAGFLFEDLAAFVLVHDHAVHHRVVNVESVAADRCADGQWEIEIAA